MATSTTDYPHDHALMFRLYIAGDADQVLLDWMETWLTNMQPWAHEGHPANDVPTLVTPVDTGNEPYYTADWWFSWGEDRAIIFDQLIDTGASATTGYLVSYADWGRVGFHECTHPGAGGPCAWDDQREFGTVPDYIEDMRPPAETT